MFRFRLGRIPIEVHLSHLLVSAAFAFTFLPQPVASGALPSQWPHRVLMDAASPDRLRTAVFYVAAWMVIVFVSVLIHELGHALAGLAFGYRPEIALVWMGGHTVPNAPGPIPWHKDVMLTAAGPLFGLMLAGAAYGVLMGTGGRSEVSDFFLINFVQANLAWAVLNLLPVLPLDGGRITTVIARRVFGLRGIVIAQGFAVLVAGAIVAYALSVRAIFLALMFGMFGLQAFKLLAAAVRGEIPEREGESQHPLAPTLAQARAALQEGKLEEARRLGTLIVATQQPHSPALEAQAHHLLGWVALKDGRGRAALDHFAQAPRQRVEPHALAASFSLIGDETRALPLWEIAWKQSGNLTVMHEYAGALIRAGRTQEALRLPRVDAASAFQCAERALFIRGAYSEAAALGEEALLHAPSADLAYDAACAFARAQDAAGALRMLERAQTLGFRDAAYVESDADLAFLHGMPAYEAWLASLKVLSV